MSRRILSIWFPRLAAERWLRRGVVLPGQPFAVVAERGGAQVLDSLNAEAEAAGLAIAQPLRDARAMCPALVTRPADPLAEAGFLAVLRRWAGRFSPLVAEEPPAGLMIDLTGCAHLFGGEAGVMAALEGDCADLGLTVSAAIADTPGAAWALARHAGRPLLALPHGDAIEQEARATRSRAGRRRMADLARPGPISDRAGRIAPVGQMRQALAALPVAALRLTSAEVAGLQAVGLRRIGDLAGLPRAALARRFGAGVLRRLDQALGLEPEPISPAREAPRFALRLSFPDPIGLRSDIEAALDRLLPSLCDRLRQAGQGARRLRLEGVRADGTVARLAVGLAQASHDPARIRAVLAVKLDLLQAEFGFDAIRLAADMTEPLHPRQHVGHLEAGAITRPAQDAALGDLIGRLGARLGPDAVTRLHPAESHIPEKAQQAVQAAWSEAHPAPWPASRTQRPLTLFRPEPVMAPADPAPPARFRWRGVDHALRRASGPERIAPEWWLDDPEWRSGPRDYWRVETEGGVRLWLFYAHGGAISGGWFAQGQFS